MCPPVLFKICLMFMTFTLWNSCFSVNSDTVSNSLDKRLALEVIKLKPQSNLVVSVIMVRIAMCKLAAVADGEAKHELLSVLGYKNAKTLGECYTSIKPVLDVTRRLSLLYINNIYVNYTDDIKNSFIANSSRTHGVRVDKVGFQYPAAAISFINRWLETATFRRITEMLNANDIDKSTTMIIISALHYKPVWLVPFDFKLRSLKKFHHYNRAIISSIPMMSRTDNFNYKEYEPCDCKIIELSATSAGIYFIIPNSPQGLPDLIDKIYKDPDLLTNAIKDMGQKLFTLFLPLFKIKTYVDWTGFLQEIGLNGIFSENSGLNSILKNSSQVKNIRLNRVKQKVFVDFDEMGPLRITRDPMYVTEPVPLHLVREFIVDRPFYFSVVIPNENLTPVDIFSGVYYGPE